MRTEENRKKTDKKQNQSQDSTSKKICFRNKM